MGSETVSPDHENGFGTHKPVLQVHGFGIFNHGFICPEKDFKNCKYRRYGSFVVNQADQSSQERASTQNARLFLIINKIVKNEN